MGDFKMGSKTVMSQSGTSNPTWGANAPTGTMIYIGETRITSAGSSHTVSDWTKTGNGTASQNLDITIPAATVAKFSKIYVYKV